MGPFSGRHTGSVCSVLYFHADGQAAAAVKPHHVVRKEANCEETRPTARAPASPAGELRQGQPRWSHATQGRDSERGHFPIQVRSAPCLSERARHFLVYSQAPKKPGAFWRRETTCASRARPRLPSFPRWGIEPLFLAWSKKECTTRQKKKGAKDRFRGSPRSEERRPLTPPWVAATSRPWPITPPTISLHPL